MERDLRVSSTYVVFKAIDLGDSSRERVEGNKTESGLMCPFAAQQIAHELGAEAATKTTFITSHFLWLMTFGAGWLGGSNLGLYDAGCTHAVGWGCSCLSWRSHSQDGSFTGFVTRGLHSLLAVGGRPQFLTTCASQWGHLRVLTARLPAFPRTGERRERGRGGHSAFYNLLLEVTVTSATFSSLEASDKIQSTFKGREIGLQQRSTEWLVSAF